MEIGLAIVALGIIGFVLIAPIVLIVRTRALARRIEALQAELAQSLSRGQSPDAPDAPAPDPQAGVEPIPQSPDLPPQDPGREETEPPPAPEEIAGADAAMTADAPAASAGQPSGRGIEERLASHWMIWLGALALGLSAVFLFRHAVEQGWLTPLFRVILGLLLGAALLSGGEWTRANPVRAVEKALRPDLIPPVLTGTGLFAIFVSLYAAHALFGLLTAATAFVALGLVAYAALALSLRHGPFVALIGLAAGYAVPALVPSPDPQAAPLFIYLFVLTLGCLAVMVWRKWWWFSYLTLAGAILWPVLWILDTWTAADQGVLGAYALGLAGAFAVLSTTLPFRVPGTPVWRWMSAMLADTSGLGFTLAGVLLLLLAVAAAFNSAAFALLGLYSALAIGLALWRGSLESLVVMAAILALTAFLIWPQPIDISAPVRAQDRDIATVGNAFGPFVMPPEFVVFSRALWAIAALFGLGGFAGIRRGRSPAVWAAVSAVVPVLCLIQGYWRIGAFEIDIQWAAVALGLAIAAMAASMAAARWAKATGNNLPMAFYAAAVTAAIALGFTCLLREAWLTVAIAAEVFAIAWIWSLTRAGPLRRIATILAAVVVVRLVANPMLLSYEGSAFGIFGWVIYGYGLPAVAIGVASRIFAREKLDLTVVFCESAALALAALMVSLQLRLWTAGSLTEPDWSFADLGLQLAWWVLVAGILLHRRVATARPWLGQAGLAILAISLTLVLLVQVLGRSPIVTAEPVGQWPLFNLLALAYLVPAVQFAYIGLSRNHDLRPEIRKLLLGSSALLVFWYLTLEVRRAFWGPKIGLSPQTLPVNAEVYAYSAVWILNALALLALGILRRSAALRFASLAVLMVTVAKVFLFDLSDLTGLYRVASFLGLGVTLMIIARIYQRFVFAPGPGTAP
ncbi:MAG: DUF2339 domain-containing protein [Marinibacterium sp.]